MEINFWKNKKVLVTGNTGFKGGWLSLWLEHLGAQVHGCALLPNTKPNLFDVARVKEGTEAYFCDIRDYSKLNFFLTELEPEIIFHLAAQPLVSDSYIDPLTTYSTNVMGLVNLLNISRNLKKLRVLVNITTDKCYENLNIDTKTYQEEDLLGGYDPYSNSKACSELITNSFRNSFFNPLIYSEHKVAIASARAGNVVGGGDWSQDRLIPDVIRSYNSKTTLQVRNPSSTRPWQHVLEPLRGYLNLAQNLYLHGCDFSGAWNFGPNEDDVKTVEWVVKEAARNLPELKYVVNNDKSFHEANYLKLNSNKAENYLNWKPLITSEEAIDKTCGWYKAFFEKKDMRAYTLKEITNYENLLGNN